MIAERFAVAALAVSIVASVALVIVYVLGGQPQLEGLFLAIALGGAGAGLAIWSAGIMEVPEASEPLHPPASAEEARRRTAAAAEVGQITRRTLLVRMLVGAGAALAAALAVPVLSLGPSPGSSLFRTGWTRGARVVTGDGVPVRVTDVVAGTVQTVFPEGEVGRADSATLLIRLRPSELALGDARNAWAPDGIVAYSKLCTHAGCPVGLYRSEARTLLCPCHQSEFDVTRGAQPVSGPAARPLPQLPLRVEADGVLAADGDFPEPVGPSFWNMTHDGDQARTTPGSRA